MADLALFTIFVTISNLNRNYFIREIDSDMIYKVMKYVSGHINNTFTLLCYFDDTTI